MIFRANRQLSMKMLLSPDPDFSEIGACLVFGGEVSENLKHVSNKMLLSTQIPIFTDSVVWRVVWKSYRFSYEKLLFGTFLIDKPFWTECQNFNFFGNTTKSMYFYFFPYKLESVGKEMNEMEILKAPDLYRARKLRFITGVNCSIPNCNMKSSRRVCDSTIWYIRWSWKQQLADGKAILLFNYYSDFLVV